MGSTIDLNADVRSRLVKIAVCTARVCWPTLLMAAPGGNGNGNPGGGRGNGGGPPVVGEDLGNNLSNPVLFSEGHGLLGLPVSDSNGLIYTNTGLRGGDLVVPPLPWDNLPDEVALYEQNHPDYVWQAVWEDRSSMGVVPVAVDWSDNLVRQQWTTQSRRALK